MTRTRRRGLLLLGLALVCGGLAAAQVRERERRAATRVGPLASVVVARRELAPDRVLRPADLALRRVPVRFAPPDALTTLARLVGARTAVPVAAGSYVTVGLLGGAAAADSGGPLRPGQRAVELPVGGGALAGAQAGSRVDVVVSTQRQDGGGRTYVALEDAEVLELRPAGGAGYAQAGTGGSPAPTALATLRVSSRQAVYLTAAASSSRAIRLLVRPPGDRGRVGAIDVEDAEL